MKTEYTVSILANGNVSIIDRGSKLRGMFSNEGKNLGGDLQLSAVRVVEIIKKGF
jgi:hypothetical protein